MVVGVARAASPAALGVGAMEQIMLDDLAQKIAGFQAFGGRGCGGIGGGKAHVRDFSRQALGRRVKSACSNIL
jgi:hypothetical protein